MVKKIDSDALTELTRALGLTGAGSPVTELADGVVDQTLDVVPIVRRSRTQHGTTGLYTAIMRNVHTDAQQLTTSVNPYLVGATAQIEPYPSPMPAQFDVWLLSATARRVSGSGTITAVLHYQYASDSQGWGIDDSGVAIVASPPVALVHWDTVVALNTAFLIQEGGFPYKHFGIRIPRGSTANNGQFEFTSSSSLTSTYEALLVLGVFPITLGQDGLS